MNSGGSSGGGEKHSTKSVPGEKTDADALFVALVLAPGTFSRNKFFALFQDSELMHARTRAKAVRSLIKELTEPWAHPGERPSRSCPIIEEEYEQEGELHLTYRVEELNYKRSILLTPLEAATLRYSLHQSHLRELASSDREMVERALSKLAPS